MKELTTEDIKEIKYQKRLAFVIAGLIIPSGMLFNFVYFLVNKDISLLTLLFINSILLILIILIPVLMNRKYNLDIKKGIKVIKQASIQKKESETSFEAGSGSLHIPILGDLFPKLFSKEMAKEIKHNLIINGFRYQVDKELFEKVEEGDLVEMFYSANSETFLGIGLFIKDHPEVSG
jgi:hypothetical protein